MYFKGWFLSFFLLFSVVNAQTKSDSTQQPVFKKHALQFQVNSIFSISDFKGTLISYKYHLNDTRAIRIGMSLRSKGSSEDRYLETDYSETQKIDQDIQNIDFSVNLSGEYLYYFNPSEEIKFFAGVGPQFNLKIQEKNTDDISYPDTLVSYSYDKANTRRTYQFGLTSVYGLEWFFHTSMSLHAEYSFSFLYNYYRYYRNSFRIYSNGEEKSVNKSEKILKGFIFNSNYVRFGMSLYF